MASSEDTPSDWLNHESGLAHTAGNSRRAKSSRPASATRLDAGDFPLLLSNEPAPPPAEGSQRQDLQRRLHDLELRAAALEADKEESINRLVFRHQQQQDALTVKYREVMSQCKTLKAENDTLRSQLDRLHRLEARREETRLHEASMADAISAQAAEQFRLQERIREEEFKAREARLAEQYQQELDRRLAEERPLFEARLKKALAALATEERKRAQQLLSNQEAELKARHAGMAERQQLERDLLHQEDLARHKAQYDALLNDLREQELIRDRLKNDMQQLIAAQEAAQQQVVSKLLGELEQLGMSLVVYHAGIGNITLPVSQLAQYLENPLAYAASQCMVTELRYRSWLEHSTNPRCNAPLGADKLCEARLIRVDSPTKFVSGQSDRCSRHQSSDAAIDNVLRFQ